MSKELHPFAFSLAECERELADLTQLLNSHRELSETHDVLPFFRDHPHLVALAGSFNPQLHQFDRFCHEFDLFGNFRCDFAVGDSENSAYTLIEFEDARENSVFGRGPKYHEEWGRRFEHGFSQLVDWFWALDAYRDNPDFRRRFGAAAPQFFGMLVVGRRHFVSEHQLERLRWRLDRVTVNANRIACLTFDDLHDFIQRRILYIRRLR